MSHVPIRHTNSNIDNLKVVSFNHLIILLARKVPLECKGLTLRVRDYLIIRVEQVQNKIAE